ncbi:aquaporin-9b isoform X2 [Astyanax mexicanus]|uniref:aquaporin-9b isoform X2 n=1 Tax=Astyanax mexicanus TaxID=7994 RepID=UPI0020CB3EE9|nr:aquaporin-9b isoform X2 [Astyanax mexicanus]
MELDSRRNLRERCALKQDILREFLAEILGTFVLILFGCGSVAQTVLSKGALGEPLTIHIGFTTGVMLAVYMAGGVSGGHVNPAVSLAMVVLGKLPLKKFPVYVVAQFIGAFAGSCAVFGLYYDALMDHTNGVLLVTGENATANIFASYPAKHLSVLNGFIDQVVGTGALVLCILAIVDRKNMGAPKGMEPLIIGLTILAIGVSMGLNCGYPINPARDLGPRLFTAIAGWGMDVFSSTTLRPANQHVYYNYCTPRIR